MWLTIEAEKKKSPSGLSFVRPFHRSKHINGKVLLKICSSYSQLKVSTCNLHKKDTPEQKVWVGSRGIDSISFSDECCRAFENA